MTPIYKFISCYFFLMVAAFVIRIGVTLIFHYDLGEASEPVMAGVSVVVALKK